MQSPGAGDGAFERSPLGLLAAAFFSRGDDGKAVNGRPEKRDFGRCRAFGRILQLGRLLFRRTESLYVGVGSGAKFPVADALPRRATPSTGVARFSAKTVDRARMRRLLRRRAPVRGGCRPGRPARPNVFLPSTSSCPKRRVSGSVRAGGRRGAILVSQGHLRPNGDVEAVYEFTLALHVDRRRPRAREGREPRPLALGATVLAEVRRSSATPRRRTRPAMGAQTTADDLRTSAARGGGGISPGKRKKERK